MRPTDIQEGSLTAAANDARGDRRRLQVIVITGPCGAGKTSTMWRLGEILASRDIPHAVIDVDYVRNFHPTPEDDPFNSRLAMLNVAAMAENFRRAGARCLILADVVEHPELKLGYGEQIPGSDIQVVRLDVPMDLLIARLERREGPATIAWYRHRSRELQGIMEERRIGDLVIDVGARTIDDVAAEIADRLGYGTAGTASLPADPE